MVIGTIFKKLGLSGLIQVYMDDIGDLYVIMVLQSLKYRLKFKRPKVTLHDRIDHFGTYIRNQETKLYQNNALLEKKP